MFKTAENYDQKMTGLVKRHWEAKRVEATRRACLGKPLSAEHRAKMSEAAKNRAPMSDEHKALRSAAAMGGKDGRGQRSVVTPMGTFDTAGVAAKALGIPIMTVRRRAKSELVDWVDWFFEDTGPCKNPRQPRR